MTPKLKEVTDMHTQTAGYLKSIVSELGSYSKQQVKGSHIDNLKNGLKADKERIEKAIKEKKTKELLKLSQKIDEEVRLASNGETISSLVTRLQKAMEKLEKVDNLKGTLMAAKQLSTKCRLLKMVGYNGDWKLDRKYVSTKMSLSEDGLTYGNTASNGYPAIIGDVPFDSGLYGYEVIPTSLDCTGKEGFGIIELDKYVAAHAADNATPTAYDGMIGFLYRNEAKNMTVERSSDMQMGSKYYVRVSMIDLTCTITGPSLSLRAELKPGVVYVPCFSLGCSSNKLQIRPLTDFDEPDASST
jgi:hypothetical protein